MPGHDRHGEGSKKKLADNPDLSFLMLLARSLNYRSVADLCESMDGEEFCLWVAEYTANPWGEERSDLRAGIIASSVANFAGKSLKDGSTVTPLDCMPYSQPEPEAAPVSADGIAAVFETFFKD